MIKIIGRIKKKKDISISIKIKINCIENVCLFFLIITEIKNLKPIISNNFNLELIKRSLKSPNNYL